MFRWTRFLIAGLAIHGMASSVVCAQEPIPAARFTELSTAERLLLQEVDTAIAEGRPQDAVERLLELTTSDSQACVSWQNEADFVCHLPLVRYLSDLLLQYRESAPDVFRLYRKRMDPVASRELAILRDSGAEQSSEDRSLHARALRARRLAENYLATTSGPDALIEAADAAAQQGWFDEASLVASRIDRRLRVWVPAAGHESSTQAKPIGVPLPLVLGLGVKPDDLAAGIRATEGTSFPLTLRSSNELTREAARRLVAYQRASGFETTDLEQFFGSLALTVDVEDQRADGDTNQADRGDPLPAKAAALLDPSWTTLGGTSQRTFVSGSLGTLQPDPRWHANFPEPLEPPPTPQDWRRSDRSPIVHPVVWQDKLLVHTGTSLRAYSIDTGESWPVAERSLPLWKSRWDSEALSPPVQLPVDGLPHHSVTLYGDLAVLRDGPPISGWLPALRRDDRSQSQLIAVDLAREGQLLEGFPWRPQIAGVPPGLEIEGTPVVINDRMYVGLTRRDIALTQSYVACLDLAGRTRWLSPVLAAARPVDGASALRVTHCVVTYGQGTLYYHANLGTVAALDAETGQIRWLTQYPRGELAADRFPRRRRAEFRDVAPIITWRDRVIVAPGDCDRVFALLRDTGQVVWATPPGEADDAFELLGVVEGHVIASGDRVYWIDALTGRVHGAFPAGVSQQPHAALPEPRGVARGLLTRDAVYFPTRDSIYVFDARLGSHGEIRKKQVIDLAKHQLQGGTLITAGNALVLTDARGIAVFGQ